ncbi:MAG: pre-peptidase C-terminal domain-containing protein, partial [Planctomycetaceae bacterium]|jgi:hypothetical protein|nr:pre-peptidase C-terminal domain-containing protein [Planctomycetaceae bacterium]
LTAKGDKNSFIRIDFDGSVGDLDLQLFNASKKSVKNVSTTGDAEKVTLNGIAAGIYYIRVYSYKQATNPSYTLTISPPAASVTSSTPVVLSATSSNSQSTTPTLTGDYQISVNNSPVVLNNTQQQNNFAYSNLSNQFFATPAEYLTNAPVIEIVGHEVSDDGKIRLQWIAQNEDSESTPNVYVSDFISTNTGEFQISATYNYYSNGTIKTGVVKSNIYSLLGLEELTQIGK